MSRIKLFILLGLLCSTSFLKGCEDNFTFSFGFIFPYFDIIAYKSGGFDLSSTYNIFLSIIINVIFVAACTILICKIDLTKRRKILSKVCIVLLINIILFDICILYSYSTVIEWVLLYYIIMPILYIHLALEEFAKISPDWNLLSRIYFFILTGILYLVASLFAWLRGIWIRLTQAKRLRHKDASGQEDEAVSSETT
jgi:hypothetical protein